MSKRSQKLSAWETARALDRIAIPLIPTLGVDEAYKRAAEELDVPPRPAAGGVTIEDGQPAKR